MPHDYFEVVNPGGCKTLAEWKSYGRALRYNLSQIDELSRTHLGHADEVAEHQDRVRWMIGDWLVAADEIGLKRAVVRKHVGDYFGRKTNKRYSEGTLNNFKTVCATIKSSRRREDLTFSHHVLVAKKEFTEEQQDRLLDLASGFIISRDDIGKRIRNGYGTLGVRGLQKRIKEHQSEGSLPQTAKVKDRASEKIMVPMTCYPYFQALALAKHYVKRPKKGVSIYVPVVDVGRLIAWMVNEYVKEHKVELDQLIKRDRKQEPAA